MVYAVHEVFKGKFLESWSLLTTIRKPIIAAVSGYAVSIDFIGYQSEIQKKTIVARRWM